MTFINNLIIKKNVIPLKSNILMLNILNNTNSINNNNFYNPIIGSNLGIPLNLLQYIYISTYYQENLITPKLVALQFAIGIFTYGSDRLIDALEYSDTSNYSIDKIDYYNYLKKNKNFNILTITLSYFYIFNLLIDNPNTYPLLILLTSTIYYKNLKTSYGEFKAIYIGFFWTIGTIILPSVLISNNYEILKEPTIILPSILNMFASSNLLDIKDIDEDKKENINTIPVIFGKNIAISMSHISIILAMLIYFNNENFYNNIYLSLLYESQSFGSFFLNFNNTKNK